MKNFKIAILGLALIPMMTMNAEGLDRKGVDRANLDESVAPGEDFYQYACGGWMKANPLQPQYSRFGTFDQLGENNREQLKELVQNLNEQHPAMGTVAQKVNDLYRQGLDSVKLNKDGAEPLKADLAKIAAAKRADFIDLIVWLHNGISNAFFGSGVGADMKNSTKNVVYLDQSGYSLGDRDYYIENDANTVKIRTAYVKYLEKMFTLCGYKASAAKSAAKNVMKIETALAKAAMPREKLRDVKSQYNPYTVAQLKKAYPNIEWDRYLAGLGLSKADTLIVGQPTFFTVADGLMKSLSDKEIKDYLAFKYIRSAATSLSDDFMEATFDMFGRTIQGTKEMQPRWKRALSVPNGILGEAVGQLYVEKYFPASSKEKMLKLVNNLKKALAEHIAGLTWMSEKTKVNALVKLNSFTVKIGYPDKWRDYSGMNIDPKASYWENIKNADLFQARYEYSQLGKPVDKDKWGMTPQTVNAYYNPGTNEICFPAGILQKPYFDPNADDAANYGAIGVVIGHEMTHGFDDEGRQFDQNGNMTDWWTKEDAAQFKTLTDKLADQYSAIKVLGETHANGRYTLGENIADHGGLRVAYTAFKKTAQGQSNEKIDGFTPDQRFYLSFANVWAGNITDQEILHRTKIDPHSLGKWRVDAALRNLEPFFEAFNIKAGDKMYLAPADRVTIW
jgi:putative endopeptidase